MRVGIGRLCLEIALGCVLVAPMDESTRWVAMCLALVSGIAAHFIAKRAPRRTFLCAHVALASAAIPVHFDARAGIIGLAAGLAFAIEVSQIDLVERRRIHEHVRTLRIPSSLLIRRLGSAVMVAVGARAAIPVLAISSRPYALAPVFVVLGVIAMLIAGFEAGPGRPVTRPIDATIFVLLAIVLAIPVS